MTKTLNPKIGIWQVLSAGKDFRRKANHVRRTTAKLGRLRQTTCTLVAAGREVLLGKADLLKSAIALVRLFVNVRNF